MLACFDKTCAMQVLASPIFNAFTQTARNHRVGRRSLWSQDFVNKLTTTASSLRSMDTRSPISLLPQPASTWFCAFLQTQMTVDRATLLLLPSCQSLFFGNVTSALAVCSLAMRLAPKFGWECIYLTPANKLNCHFVHCLW